MKLRIDYLNKRKEPRHIFTDTDNVWWELQAIIEKWASDIFIYAYSYGKTDGLTQSETDRI